MSMQLVKRVVVKDEFFTKLMAETRDVVSSCESTGRKLQRSTFTYRYPNAPFGTIDADYNSYPTIEVYKLAE